MHRVFYVDPQKLVVLIILVNQNVEPRPLILVLRIFNEFSNHLQLLWIRLNLQFIISLDLSVNFNGLPTVLDPLSPTFPHHKNNELNLFKMLDEYFSETVGNIPQIYYSFFVVVRIGHHIKNKVLIKYPLQRKLGS